MSEERKKILEMLADGKIDVSEAERLLEAVGKLKENDNNKTRSDSDSDKSRKKLKYFKVLVMPKNSSGESVNIKIPLGLIKAGVKLGSIIPGKARDKVNVALEEKGINLNVDDLNSKSIESILEAMADTCIDINDEKETVKIYCE